MNRVRSLLGTLIVAGFVVSAMGPVTPAIDLSPPAMASTWSSQPLTEAQIAEKPSGAAITTAMAPAAMTPPSISQPLTEAQVADQSSSTSDVLAVIFQMTESIRWSGITVASSLVTQGPIPEALIDLGSSFGQEPAAFGQEPVAPQHAEVAEAVDADLDQLASLSDEELAGVSAGDYQITLDRFDVMIQDNQAGQFTMDISEAAFNGAQGVFTTLQTVNSAVDISVIVNIYVNQQ